jgi:hypothetical protein
MVEESPGNVTTPESRPSPAEGDGRDQEFAFFYKREMHRLIGFLMTVSGARADGRPAQPEAMMEAYLQWDESVHPKAGSARSRRGERSGIDVAPESRSRTQTSWTSALCGGN